MSIGQKRVIRHLTDVITTHLDTLASEVNELRKEIRVEELDQVDRDMLAMYDGVMNNFQQLSSSFQQIKDAKYSFEHNVGYGKIFFLDFTLGRQKNEV